MSARRSTALPRACSGLMYPAVPRIDAALVGESVIVGDRARSASESADAPFASPKSSTLTWPSGVILTLPGFRSRWIDAAVVRGLDCRRDLAADVERFVHREGPFRETRRERVAGDVFKNEELTLIGLFDAVNRRDIGMAQGGEQLGFAIESDQASAFRARASGRTLIATRRFSRGSRAR